MRTPVCETQGKKVPSLASYPCYVGPRRSGPYRGEGDITSPLMLTMLTFATQRDATNCPDRTQSVATISNSSPLGEMGELGEFGEKERV